MMCVQVTFIVNMMCIHVTLVVNMMHIHVILVVNMMCIHVTLVVNMMCVRVTLVVNMMCVYVTNLVLVNKWIYSFPLHITSICYYFITCLLSHLLPSSALCFLNSAFVFLSIHYPK